MKQLFYAIGEPPGLFLSLLPAPQQCIMSCDYNDLLVDLYGKDVGEYNELQIGGGSSYGGYGGYDDDDDNVGEEDDEYDMDEDSYDEYDDMDDDDDEEVEWDESDDEESDDDY